ncbi:MAG: type 4a pilus biogenesis protein PilO [Candidatus Omnitrophica bacterium]|nr:type 4a pilus biogenesis protein PilO [Candidatus Omnitrophota bacterium]
MKSPTIQLEPSQQVLLGLTAAGLGFVLSVRFIYLPVRARIGERRAMLTDLKVKIADAHAFAQRLPGEEHALLLARERYDVLEGRIGRGQSVARVLELLSAQAKDHRLELVAIHPRMEEGEQDVMTLGPDLALREIPLRLQLTGPYRQLGAFVGELSSAPFLAAVQELQMTKPQADRAELKADLLLAVYLTERSPAR